MKTARPAFVFTLAPSLACFLSVMAQAASGVCPGDGTNSAVVAEYVFGEGSGSVAHNTGTDEDAGNLSLVNGAEFGTNVPPANEDCGWSLVLPNSGSGSTTPAAESADTYEVLEGSGAFTIMAWVRRESAGANNNTSARIVSDTSSLALTSTTAGVEFRFSGSAGTLSLRINGAEVGTGVGGVAPNTNAWHHVAVVYDGARPATNTLTRNVHFYVDGIQRGDGNTLQGAVVGANSNRLTVGNSSVSRGVGNLMVGKIDDVLILWGFAPDAVGNGKTNDTIRCYMLANDDIEPPELSCPADVTVNAETGTCAAASVALGEPDATDNCGLADVVHDAPSSFPVGVTWVTWTATDYAGNSSSCTQAVTVRDATAPAIVCPADLTVEAGPCLAAITNFVPDEPEVSDDCGIAGWTSVAPGAFPVGVTSIVWRVWDAAGNTNACLQQITVIPSTTADCDGDGLTDWEEVNTYGSNPENPSTAGDGLSDGWKVQYGFDPTNPVPVECRPRYW